MLWKELPFPPQAKVHGDADYPSSPFLSFVKDRKSFDDQLSTYVQTSYVQEKYACTDAPTGRKPTDMITGTKLSSDAKTSTSPTQAITMLAFPLP